MTAIGAAPEAAASSKKPTAAPTTGESDAMRMVRRQRITRPMLRAETLRHTDTPVELGRERWDRYTNWDGGAPTLPLRRCDDVPAANDRVYQSLTRLRRRPRSRSVSQSRAERTRAGRRTHRLG